MSGGRFSRWSKMKADNRNKDRAGRGRAAPVDLDAPVSEQMDLPELEPENKEGQAVAALDPDHPVEDEKAEKVALEDLPDIEELDEGSDYSPFLQDDVPEEKHREAMKKLWRSNPDFNFRDGLDDYDDDFTIIHAIKDTVYRVGKGMLSEEEIEAEKMEQAEKSPEGDLDAAAQNDESGESVEQAEMQKIGENGNDFHNDSNEAQPKRDAEKDEVS